MGSSPITYRGKCRAEVARLFWGVYIVATVYIPMTHQLSKNLQGFLSLGGFFFLSVAIILNPL